MIMYSVYNSTVVFDIVLQLFSSLPPFQKCKFLENISYFPPVPDRELALTIE